MQQNAEMGNNQQRLRLPKTKCQKVLQYDPWGNSKLLHADWILLNNLCYS